MVQDLLTCGNNSKKQSSFNASVHILGAMEAPYTPREIIATARIREAVFRQLHVAAKNSVSSVSCSQPQ